MRIAVVSDWFSPAMGYAENYLPPAFARLGHEVHLLTSDFQVYANSADYDAIYRRKLGPKQVADGMSEFGGCTLHRMRGRIGPLGVQILDLHERLRQLRPDVVYCFEISCPTSRIVAAARRELGYRMYCESRLHDSIFSTVTSPGRRIMRFIKYRLQRTANIVRNVDRFYPVAPDVLEIITSHLGVPTSRCTLISLAVETSTFHPAVSHGRAALRDRLGLPSDALICVYTGRFTIDKDPITLARAIELLHERGHTDFLGLFIGEGKEYSRGLLACRGAIVRPFVTPAELADIYRSVDIGVWPRQESTSQLDAMACGLPIVVNDTVTDPIRIGEWSRTFRAGDPQSLADVLLSLRSASLREQLGKRAAALIQSDYSWDAAARARIADFTSPP
jgi:glycosyltransferase involved in cell wall biosynthesis